MKWMIILLLFMPFPALAQEIVQEQFLSNAQQEQRAKALFSELRCEVCAGQSLADSNAALASDMRKLVREKVGEGLADDEILQFFSSRYGDNILMRPPRAAHTALLWWGPWLVMGLGALAIFGFFGKRGKNG